MDSYLRDSTVKLKINPENGASDEGLARQLGVTGYPTVFVILPGGGPQTLSLYERGGDRLRRPDDFVADIETRLMRQAGELFNEGAAARRAGRFDQAVDKLTRALRLRPDDPRTYLERGLTHVDSGAHEDALDDFALAARLKPDNATAIMAAQELLSRQSRWDESIACWTGFIEKNPSNGKAYLARSQLLAKKGIRGLSGSDAEKACQLGEVSACRRGAEGASRKAIVCSRGCAGARALPGSARVPTPRRA